MKIGLDFHGVINADPGFFSQETKSLIEQGHEIHIITGHEDIQCFRDEFETYSIIYTHFFSIVSYHKSIGTTVKYDANNQPWIDTLLWDKSKADYCQKNNIDILIDDTARYGKYFEDIPTAFLHMDTFNLIRKIWEMEQNDECECPNCHKTDQWTQKPPYCNHCGWGDVDT